MDECDTYIWGSYESFKILTKVFDQQCIVKEQETVSTQKEEIVDSPANKTDEQKLLKGSDKNNERVERTLPLIEKNVPLGQELKA